MFFFNKKLVFCFFLAFIFTYSSSVRVPKIASLDSTQLFAEIKTNVILLQFLANPTNDTFTNLIKKEIELNNDIEIVSNAMLEVTNDIEMQKFRKRVFQMKDSFYRRNFYIVNDHVRNNKFRRSIKRKIYQEIKRVLDREGFNILIDKNKLLYIDKEFDITKKVLKKMKDKLSKLKEIIIAEIKKEKENTQE